MKLTFGSTSTFLSFLVVIYNHPLYIVCSHRDVFEHDALMKITSESEWKTFSSYSNIRAAEVFTRRVNDISRDFRSCGATVNIAVIGACDGTHDRTIESFYTTPHWSILLVEPISYNFLDLEKNLAFNNATARAVSIRAAVTNRCDHTTINMTMPDWYLRDRFQEHWAVRQTATLNKGIISQMKRAVRMVSRVECKKLFQRVYVFLTIFFVCCTIKLTSSFSANFCPITKHNYFSRAKNATNHGFMQESVPCMRASTLLSEWHNRLAHSTSLPHWSEHDTGSDNEEGYIRCHILKVSRRLF